MIIIDSNVWIFAEIKDMPEHTAAVSAIQSLISSGEIGTNVIVLSEVFHKISKLYGSPIAVERVRAMQLHPVVVWISFNQKTAVNALNLAEETKLRINDALIAQQALEMKAPVLTDNVKDFRKVKGLKVMKLR